MKQIRKYFMTFCNFFAVKEKAIFKVIFIYHQALKFYLWDDSRTEFFNFSANLKFWRTYINVSLFINISSSISKHMVILCNNTNGNQLFQDSWSRSQTRTKTQNFI